MSADAAAQLQNHVHAWCDEFESVVESAARALGFDAHVGRPMVVFTSRAEASNVCSPTPEVKPIEPPAIRASDILRRHAEAFNLSSPHRLAGSAAEPDALDSVEHDPGHGHHAEDVENPATVDPEPAALLSGRARTTPVPAPTGGVAAGAGTTLPGPKLRGNVTTPTSLATPTRHTKTAATPPDGWLTVKEAATAYGVSYDAMFKRIYQRGVESVKVGSRRYVPPPEEAHP